MARPEYLEHRNSHTSWLTLPEAAHHFGVSTHTIRRWIREGRLPAEKRPGRFGEQYFIPASAILSGKHDAGSGNTEAPALPVDLHDRLQIVGRDAELGALQDLLRTASTGKGQFVLLGGEAGIGKTTLVQWLTDEAAEAGFRVLIGHSYDLDMASPFGPWIDLMQMSRSSDDGIVPPSALVAPGSLGSLAGPREFYAQVWSFFEGLTDDRPLVLVLEDIHWSDQSSLELLRFIGRQVGDCPILVIATYRDIELSPDQPLYRLLPHIIRDTRATRITLRRLTHPAVADLVASRYDLQPADQIRLVEFLLRYAEGNPFFTNELLSTLEFDEILRTDAPGWSLGDLGRFHVPRLLHQMLDDHLGRLDQQSRDLLQIAAVLGDEIQLDLWQAVAQVPDETLADVLQQAIDAHVLVELLDRPTLRFRHALVRRALYERMILLRRRTWHRRAGEVLAGQPTASPDIVAYHFEQANDPRSIDWHIRAGDRAREFHAPNEAIDHYAAALDLAQSHGLTASPTVVHRRGKAYATVGSFDRARQDFEASLQLARESGNHELAWEVLIDLGALWGERDYKRAGQSLRQALDLAREIDDPLMLASSLNRLGNWHLNIEEIDRGLAFYGEALTIFEQHNNMSGTAATYDLLAVGKSLRGDLFDAERYTRAALDAYRRLNARQGEAQALSRLPLCAALSVWDPLVPSSITSMKAQQAGERAVEITHEIGWQTGEPYHRCFLAAFYISRGRPHAALTQARAALELARTIQHRQGEVFANNVHSRIFVDLLHPDQSCEYGLRALQLARELNSVIWTYRASADLALALIDQGDLDQAERILDDAFPRHQAAMSAGQYYCHYAWACLLLRSGIADQALEIIDHLQSSIPRWTPSTISPRLAYLRGQVLFTLGRYEEALKVLMMAREVMTRLEARGYQWRIDVELARVHQALGNLEAARHSCQQVEDTLHAIAGEIDDPQMRSDFVQRALERLPETRHMARTSRLPAGLSPRELEVLRLVAEGLSDAEIGGRLYISPRTVSGHLQSIYNKLGISSRTAATAFAYEHDLF